MTKETNITEIRAVIAILEDSYTELNLWLSSSSDVKNKTPQDVFAEVANIHDARSFLDEAINKLEKIESVCERYQQTQDNLEVERQRSIQC